MNKLKHTLSLTATLEYEPVEDVEDRLSKIFEFLFYDKE